MEELKVLELFSGIGGYHSALQIIDGKLSRHKLKVIGAVDINTVSNEVAFLLFIFFQSEIFVAGLQAHSSKHPLSSTKHNRTYPRVSEVSRLTSSQ